jgi:uncharacterized alpha-E superfamily protein
MLCGIAQSQLRAVLDSMESTRKFRIEFHVELHSVAPAVKFLIKLSAMPHSVESRLRAMRHSGESLLCAVRHNMESIWNSAESIP